MVTITYQKAKIQIPDFLADLWPVDLPLDSWPTYCGAGEGIGDLLVPERICGVDNSCGCFVHDIQWALADDSFFAAMVANWNLYCNLRAITLANYDHSKYSKGRVERGCLKYFLGTIIGTVKSFTPDGSYEDPFASPTVKARFKKLATVHDVDPQLYQ